MCVCRAFFSPLALFSYQIIAKFSTPFFGIFSAHPILVRDIVRTKRRKGKPVGALPWGSLGGTRYDLNVLECLIWLDGALVCNTG